MMMRRTLLCFFLLVTGLLPGVASAQSARAIDPVLDAMRIGSLLAIMAEESAQHGAELDRTVLMGEGGAGWARIVASIHDPERWEPRLRDHIARRLAEDGVAAVSEFLTSERAGRIIDLELSARRAFLDAAIEEASAARAERLREDNAPLIAQIDRFVAANDLIDANVAGTLNANLAFLRGLDSGGAAQDGDIAAQVWQQEPEIRATTTDWVYSYLALAFGPLPTEDLDAYITFSESAAGEAFNAALFSAFDAMFVETAHALGLALGRMMAAEDI